MSYWQWFLFGGKGKGWRKFIDRWLYLHIVAGFAIASVVRVDLATAATTVLLPLVGTLIGLSFAWAGNAQALLQTEEIEELSIHRPGGFQEYVFTYQSAILVILVAVILWGLAALGVFDLACYWNCPMATHFATKAVLFTFTSLTIRECWQVVLAAQVLLLLRRKIRDSKK